MKHLEILKHFEEPPIDDFDGFIDHLGSHHLMQNMHLRDTKQKDYKRHLRYLHMVKYESKNKSIGHIIGPEGLEYVYELTKVGRKVNLFVSDYDGSTKELIRITKQLTKKLFARANSESSRDDSDDHFSNYKKGEFYLRRNKAGMDFNHPNIQNALKQDVITEEFARKIKEWGFELVNP